jgi:hypothetical protein
MAWSRSSALSPGDPDHPRPGRLRAAVMVDQPITPPMGPHFVERELGCHQNGDGPFTWSEDSPREPDAVG